MRRDDPRYRTTQAFRKLRRMAPREFDALYMFCKLRYDIRTISSRMNEEMERRQLPDRFSPDAVTLLLYSGVDKVMRWW